MEAYKQVYKKLEELNIEYEVVNHPPATTMEEADLFIEGKEGVRTKSLFLCNHKKTEFYLIIMDENKRLNIKNLNKLLNQKNIHFASIEILEEKMGLKPGIVSLFGIINNKDHDIKIYIDEEILSENIITFTANDNTKTIFITKENMFRFISLMGYNYTTLVL